MTPRCFAAWTQGRSKAAERDVQNRMVLAYQTAFFYRVEKPKKLDHYLNALKPKKAQTPDEMLAVFREFAARGSPMNIKQVN